LRKKGERKVNVDERKIEVKILANKKRKERGHENETNEGNETKKTHQTTLEREKK